MSPFERTIVSLRRPFQSQRILWKVTAGFVVAALAILVRGCGYDAWTVTVYAAYFAAYVALPGVVVLGALNRGPVSLTAVLALALPTGFAIEIFSYLGMASMGARGLYPYLPVFWLAVGALLWRRRGVGPVRWRVTGAHAGVALGLAVAFFGVVFMAAGEMFAESPLSAGLPSRAIFHDWVYLVSRAAVIKNNWPLDDPSLSGTPLQYHYFMMVHAAAASGTTGVEVTLVLLRLMVVPLGAVLVAQAYLMGRLVARSPWGGVVAALLVVAASEVSFAGDYSHPMFLGLFSRWLFVSPTFYFGVIFCGALLIAVAQCARLARCGLGHYAWLFLLATAGTGAKGTVLPVLICGLGLWAGWRMVRERMVPWRLVTIGTVLGVGFAIVYLETMSSWRTGDAAFRPFHIFQLATFWATYLPLWQHALEAWLPGSVAYPMAAVACGLVIFVGTCGVRVLAIPYLLNWTAKGRDPMVPWLGAFFVACTGMGLLMELNSFGELYLFLMIRVPMAVLAAAQLVEGYRKFKVWRLDAAPGQAPKWARWLGRTGLRGLVGAAAAAVVLVSAIQSTRWLSLNRAGIVGWLTEPAQVPAEDHMKQLQEALLWIRTNSEPNAVIVANACTPENMKNDYWGALDRTLTGVHFYYSALSERRMWFEGPSYIMDTTRARIRANLASAFFYREQPLDQSLFGGHPCYVLVDRSLADGASVGASPHTRVFANARIDVYRMSGTHADFMPGGASLASDHDDD